MALVSAAIKQTIVLRSYAALGSRDEGERHRAMEAMRECGSSARWCLHLAARQTGQPRVQFAAAVVLHHLNDRQGLLTLTEALKWRLPSQPLLAPELEAAFIKIGSPDAVSALLTVWNMLPDWGDHEPIRASICRVWAALKNPVVLRPLAAAALLIPDRFEQTIPAFGEMAIPILREMARSPKVQTRRLSAQCLRHIPSANAFAALLPLLRDWDPSVRALIPPALERTGDQAAAVVEISKAVRTGYASITALETLDRVRPCDLAETLTAMFEVWSAGHDVRVESQLLLMGLTGLARLVVDEQRLASALAKLLDELVEPGVAIAMIQAIETLVRRSGCPGTEASESILRQLMTPNTAIREQAALSLARIGDLFPASVLAFLEDCKPQDSFFSQLQSMLRGGRDAGQAATQAVQQVSKWWARLTSDSGPIAPGTVDFANLRMENPSNDGRLPELLRRMLASGMGPVKSHLSPAEIHERTTFAVLVLRALARLGMPAARCAYSEIVALLHVPADMFVPLGGPSDLDACRTVALAAAETLRALYGVDSFCLYLEAVYSHRREVVQSGIMALGMLGDSRGLQYLRPIASNDRHPCSSVARQAIAQIQRTNPEMMSLLRGSTPSAADPGTLLRAARNTGSTGYDLLLRPTREHSD